jgi:hypothetical protein
MKDIKKHLKLLDKMLFNLKVLRIKREIKILREEYKLLKEYD